VLDLQEQSITLAAHPDVHSARSALCRDTVVDRVFDERLKREGRYFCAGEVLRDVEHGDQPISKAQPFELEVALHRFELDRERDLRRARSVERVTKERGQTLDGALGLHRVFGDQCGDGVERVEQEMRIRARLERFEARDEELTLRLLLAELRISRAIA